MSQHTDKLTAKNVPRANFATAWSYAPAPESGKVTIAPRYDLFINGKFVPPVKGKYFPTINPANEKKLSEVGDASTEDVNKAVKAARGIRQGLVQNGRQGTGKIYFSHCRILQERAREFAIIESMDGGKPIRESRDVDIPLASAHFFYYAGWADKLDYAFPGRTVRSLGVAGQIIPWNFPLLMAAWKIHRSGNGKHRCA